MSPRLALVIGFLVIGLSACGAAVVPDPSPIAGPPGAAPSPSAPPSTADVATPTPEATPEPTRTPKPTAVPVPAKPTGVKFDEDVDCLGKWCGRASITQTVMWKTPRAKRTTIRVYGVTECLARPDRPEPGDHGRCLVLHTALPESVRTLLATAPAADGWVSWSWKQETGCETNAFASNPRGPTYYAIVVAAYNESGHSIFTIADPGRWWEPDEGDMVC